MTKKRKIILLAVALSILLAIGVSLTYIFAVALPQKREVAFYFPHKSLHLSHLQILIYR